MQYLTEELSTYFTDLLAMADACAELDWYVDCMSFNITLIDSCIHSLLSLAHAARLHEYVRPEMTEENKIDIRQGR